MSTNLSHSTGKANILVEKEFVHEGDVPNRMYVESRLVSS